MCLDNVASQLDVLRNIDASPEQEKSVFRVPFTELVPQTYRSEVLDLLKRFYNFLISLGIGADPAEQGIICDYRRVSSAAGGNTEVSRLEHNLRLIIIAVLPVVVRSSGQSVCAAIGRAGLMRDLEVEA